MKLRFKHVIGLILPTLLTALTACGGGGGGGSSSSACDPIKIAGGQSCEVNNSAVVKLLAFTPDGLRGCSGTMVSSDLVLTAGHCLVGASQVVVEASNGTTANANLFLFDANFNANRSMDFGIAIVQPDFAATAGITPLPIYLGADIQLSQGVSISVFGYGREDGRDGFRQFPRVANMTVESLDFIDPFDSIFSFTAVPDFSGNAPGAGCMGDSGGPALVADHSVGIIGVAGVLSAVRTDSCSQSTGRNLFAGITCGLVDVLRQYTGDLRTVSECV